MTSEQAIAENALEGLYLEQNGTEYNFLRIYADGELLFASMTYTWPRQKTLADVTRWFARGHKKLHVKPYRYRYENGKLAFEYAIDGKRFEVRGEVDSLKRIALLWNDVDLGNQWLHVYSKIGDKGETLLPVHVNVAGTEILSELPGINKGLAMRIVEHREAHGDFAELSALLQVKGVNEDTLATLAVQLNFAPAPVIRITPESRVLITRELMAKIESDTEDEATPAQRAARLQRLGRFDVYWEKRYPRPGELTVLAYARGEDALVLRGYDVDDSLLEPLLEVVDACTPEELRQLRGVRVLPFESTKFDRIVVVPGHVKSYHPLPFGHAVHRFYPARSFEVADGMSGEDFEQLCDYGKRVRLAIFDWNRDPLPLMRLQVHTPLTNSPYKKMKRAEFVNYRDVGQDFEKSLHSGRVEIGDVLGRHAFLKGSQEAIQVEVVDLEGRTQNVAVPHVSFRSALERFLNGGSFG
jgi:hypothetical protein